MLTDLITIILLKTNQPGMSILFYLGKLISTTVFVSIDTSKHYFDTSVLNVQDYLQNVLNIMKMCSPF